MKLLIVYGTTDGHTQKIGEFLRDEAVKRGHVASLCDAGGPDLHPDGFDGVIVAASVHASEYQSTVKKYVIKHHETLNKIPTIFVSVSLTAAGTESDSWEELGRVTEKFLDKTGWKPDYVEQVAGALRYSQYNIFKKFIMRMIVRKNSGDTDTSKDYEYTDWNQVKHIIQKMEPYEQTSDV